MQQQTQGVPQTGGDDISQNKGITYLSYIGILCLVPLLGKKESKFAQFHAKQGLVMLIGEVVTPIITIIPILGWILGPLLWIFWLVLIIMGLINVSKGEMKELPIVGSFANKFNI